MNQVLPLVFHQTDLCERIDALSETELDSLDFGVIGFDAEYVVRRYNAFESKLAGLAPHRVLGNKLFTVVAPCMNNFMVAQRFEDAASDGATLDETLDYVLTMRMQPFKVSLRLLASSRIAMRYVLVRRPS